MRVSLVRASTFANMVSISSGWSVLMDLEGMVGQARRFSVQAECKFACLVEDPQPGVFARNWQTRIVQRNAWTMRR
jgi:hypothetical protein